MFGQRLPLYFYRTAADNEPVRGWLKKLPEDDRRAIGQDLGRVQWHWPVGMPLCRSLGDGLWEVRTSLPSNREARVFFVLYDGEIVILHGFIKKSQKTPKAELELAKKRQKEFSDDE